MNDLSARPEESLSLVLRIDAACQSFEAAWKAARDGGTRPRIEDHLAAAPEAERGLLLQKLLPVEMHYRRSQSPSADEHRRRFPEFGHLIESFLEPPRSVAGDTVESAVKPGGGLDPYSTGPELPQEEQPGISSLPTRNVNHE
jgi:hypothetical protein